MKKMTFLAILYIMQDLIQKGYLHTDPNDDNRVLIYRTAGTKQPEGWYSQNIHEAASETFQNKTSLKEFLEYAENAGVDIEANVNKADSIIHKGALI